MTKKLIFKRKAPLKQASGASQYYRVRCSAETYNAIVEIAEETGKSLKYVTDKLIEYAAEYVQYESEVNNGIE